MITCGSQESTCAEQQRRCGASCFYRKKHLLVTTLIALFFLAIPMFSMEFVGTSDIAPTSVAVIFLTCLAAGLWTLQNPVLGVLAYPFLVFVTALFILPRARRFPRGSKPSYLCGFGIH